MTADGDDAIPHHALNEQHSGDAPGKVRPAAYEEYEEDARQLQHPGPGPQRAMRASERSEAGRHRLDADRVSQSPSIEVHRCPPASA